MARRGRARIGEARTGQEQQAWRGAARPGAARLGMEQQAGMGAALRGVDGQGTAGKAGRGGARHGKEQQASKQKHMELTITESKRLVELEKTIQRGKVAFVEVGNALAEIRDSKLYRIEYSTFEEYCQEKWGWTKQHAYRLIECAPIAESNPQVTSINQARELKKVPAEQREKVLDKAANSAQREDRPLTAKDIHEAAQDESSNPQDDSEAERPSVQVANLEDYQDHGQKRDLDVASVRSNMEAMITNVINYAPLGELPKFKSFLEAEAQRVRKGMH